MTQSLNRRGHVRAVTKAAMLSVSAIAIAAASATDVRAQAAPQTTAQASASQLPPVQVDEPNRKPRRTTNAPNQRNAAAARPRQAPARTTPPTPPSPVANPANTFDARTGTVGIYSNSTWVATKTNTPLINIPQSVSVLTKDFIRDQNFQQLTDVTRYVPGVAVHQGEGNRDELVIRGVDSSANFFVNGFRDDVQIFRDLYNTQSIEILKGPSMLTFGRGSGGGILNRTLKEADGQRVYEATMQAGSYADRRVTLDAGQAVNENVAARINVMYEAGDGFRQYTDLQRWGINPTLTVAPNDTTKVKFSFESYHDNRTADRGNPSQALNSVAPSSTRFNPAQPFAPNGDLTKFFGSPTLNRAIADVNTGMMFVDHDFLNGLTVKNGTLVADYKKFYQNVYPGNGALSGAVNPADTAFNRAAYNHETDRQNAFNQTDWTYKGVTGPLRHTLGFGTEFGYQTGIDVRNTGVFANGSNTIVGDPNNPTFFGPVTFVHHSSGVGNTDGVTAADSNSKYTANIQSAYVRDTIEVTPWLQLIGGVRFDRFDLSATDQNVNITRGHVDNLVSPQGAVIVKPRENLSFYAVYSQSYLPASGDQFSALSPGTAILDPQGFENKEIGVKWNIFPRLIYTAAIYQLDRTNVPLNDPSGSGLFFLSGKNRIRGFENELTGYITPDWESKLGYAYTDARVMTNTGNTTAAQVAAGIGIAAGNRVQLVPLHQFSLWNKYQVNEWWAGGLGIIYFSDSFASSDDTVKLPGFWRVDASVYRKIDEHWRVQLNVENIFDKGYWASADGNNNISPGQGRTFRFLAVAKF